MICFVYAYACNYTLNSRVFSSDNNFDVSDICDIRPFSFSAVSVHTTKTKKHYLCLNALHIAKFILRHMNCAISFTTKRRHVLYTQSHCHYRLVLWTKWKKNPREKRKKSSMCLSDKLYAFSLHWMPIDGTTFICASTWIEKILNSLRKLDTQQTECCDSF